MLMLHPVPEVLIFTMNAAVSFLFQINPFMQKARPSLPIFSLYLECFVSTVKIGEQSAAITRIGF